MYNSFCVKIFMLVLFLASIYDGVVDLSAKNYGGLIRNLSYILVCLLYLYSIKSSISVRQKKICQYVVLAALIIFPFVLFKTWE